MVQGMNKQFLEVALKHTQAMAQSKNLSGSQDAAFKGYMQAMCEKRDNAARGDNLGKKIVDNPKEQLPPKDEIATDTPQKDDSITTADNKPVEGSESGQEDENANVDDAAQRLIELAALAMQMSDNMVQDGKTSKITNVVIDGVPQAETEVAPVMAKLQGGQQETISGSQVAEQLLAEAGKVQEKPQAAVLSSQVPTEKPAPLVLKPENVGAKATQVVSNAETTKTAENAEALKEAANKVGEAKPIEIKVEVKTGQNEAQTGKQATTEEVAENMVTTVKPEKAEMPTITLKVGDGGQINTQEMAKDVADAIVKKMPQNVNEFEIKITPKELGTITIKLLFENGQTLVSLSAGNAKTTGLLAECAKTIGAMIQQHTGNETVVTVQDDKNLSDQQRQEGNRQNAESKQQEEAKKHRQQQSVSQDFVQQMRLGLFDGEVSDGRSRFY